MSLLLDTLNRIMDPLSVTGTLIAVLQITGAVISICYDYRQGAKNASREVIQISDELNSLKDVLDALLRMVEKDESSDATTLATFELLTKPNGPLAACQTELEILKAKLEPEKGWRAVRQSLAWPLKEGEMRKTLSSLERMKSTMLLALSADQTALNLAVHQNVKYLTREFQERNASQEYQQIIQWLKASDPQGKHIFNLKKRQPETGNWFIFGKRYEEWFQSPGSFLWLYGIPGSGKTMLCTTVIEHLVLHCQKTPRTATAYFYFDFSDPGKQDLNSLLRSLLTQLSTQCSTIPPSLLLLYRQYRNGTASPGETELMTTFRDLVLMFDSVYIVLDALDEGSNCEELLRFIDGVQNWGFSRLHLMTSSRPLPEIEQAMRNSATDKLCLEDSGIRDDIKLYVNDRLATSKILLSLPAGIRREIRQKLLADNTVMFQWVAMAMGLPRNLDDTYDQILLRIDPMYRPQAMNVLKALTVCEEPLTLEEVADLLAVDLEARPPRFDPDKRLLDPQSILTMCSCLVSTSKEIEKMTSRRSKPVLVLELAHASVADYLTHPTPLKYPQFHFSRYSARRSLAQACLVYLLNPEFAEGAHGGVMERLDEFPFLMHAVWHWPLYLQKEAGDPEDDYDPFTQDLIHRFFATHKLPSGGNFLFWVAMLIPDAPDAFINDTQPLYYAASFGLTDVVRVILETEPDIDIDALGGRHRSSAMHVASYRNHYDVVKLLLERGADPNLPNDLGESAMYWANREISELLEEYGATEESRYE
ncbi:hypothetical protein F5884DRAFT_778825 [Xylogone sp. PMI_703]|nr:hypothetical protein F5884DRAFT_778825 [Xylogone sp. PMI_703]